MKNIVDRKITLLSLSNSILPKKTDILEIKNSASLFKDNIVSVSKNRQRCENT